MPLGRLCGVNHGDTSRIKIQCVGRGVGGVGEGMRGGEWEKTKSDLREEFLPKEVDIRDYILVHNRLAVGNRRTRSRFGRNRGYFRTRSERSGGGHRRSGRRGPFEDQTASGGWVLLM